MLDDELRSGLSDMAGEPPVTIDLERVRSTGLRKRRNRSIGAVSAAVVVVCGLGFGLTSFLRSPALIETDVADDGGGVSDIEVPSDGDSDSDSESDSENETEVELESPDATTAPSPPPDDVDPIDSESNIPTTTETTGSGSDGGQSGGTDDEPMSDDQQSVGSIATTTTSPEDAGGPSSTATESTSTVGSSGKAIDDGFVCQANSLGRVTWNDRDQDLYRVYRSSDDGDTYQWLDRTDGKTSYLDTDHQSEYLYRIDYEGIRWVSCEVLGGFACEVDGTGRVSWTDDDQPTYQVYRSTDGGQTFPWFAKSTNDTYVEDSDYQRDFQYRVNFSASDSAVNCPTAR